MCALLVSFDVFHMFLWHHPTLRVSREAQEKLELEKHRAERPKIQQQFADLKRGLSAVTDEEWENIPEVGNLTRKKRRREERSFVVPDSVLVGDRNKNEYENSLDARQQEVRYLRSSLYDNVFIAIIDGRFCNASGIRYPHEFCGNWPGS